MPTLDDDQEHRQEDPSIPARRDDPASDGSLPLHDSASERPEPEARYREDERTSFGQGISDPPPPSEIDPIIDEEEFDYQPEEEESGMGFFDHLEELRGRLIKSLIALAVTAGVCAYFYRDIAEKILLAPARDVNLPLINTEPMGQLTITIQVVIISGLILAIPFIIWQFWGFVKPGLYEKERRYVSVIAFATILCFLTGVSFAYFVMIPASLTFIKNFEIQPVSNQIAISSFFSFVLGFILACGVVFEMPMLSYALSRFGVITPAFLRKYRRHSAVIILVVAAIITPTPDPFNQMLLAVPLYGLYEISIIVAATALRQRTEEIVEEIEEGREKHQG